MGILANISIHAPRTGSDRITSLTSDCHTISIHAPRTGSDCEARTTSISGCYFNPRSPHGERLRLLDFVIHVCKFQSTLPARGATSKSRRQGNPQWISIHAPRTGSDFLNQAGRSLGRKFQSTLPARGATDATPSLTAPCKNFNPRSPHGERLTHATQSIMRARFQSTLPARGATQIASGVHKHAHISIHAPRTGSDVAYSTCLSLTPYFNPRSPHGERRQQVDCHKNRFKFQSTLPARGATINLLSGRLPVEHFNPRSPHGERRAAAARCANQRNFNPRSPHGERRKAYRESPGFRHLFQSTLPARGATSAPCTRQFQQRISIHAPRTGSDYAIPKGAFDEVISIHAPRTGSDGTVGTNRRHSGYFNPRSPHGERRQRKNRADEHQRISIHAPRTGSDTPLVTDKTLALEFQSTLPARGATHQRY